MRTEKRDRNKNASVRVSLYLVPVPSLLEREENAELTSVLAISPPLELGDLRIDANSGTSSTPGSVLLGPSSSAWNESISLVTMNLTSGSSCSWEAVPMEGDRSR